ncbi:MAG: CPBP family intramembrane glutamate endopeptidase, partial [Stackebrandtia sp.]
MSSTSGNNPQDLADQSRSGGRRRAPGWPEIGVGLAVVFVLEFGLTIGVTSLGAGPVAFGVFMTALSAIVTVAAFTAAVGLRIRSWSAFGVRHTSVRWLLIG